MDIEEANKIEYLNNKSEEELLNYKYRDKTIKSNYNKIWTN